MEPVSKSLIPTLNDSFLTWLKAFEQCNFIDNEEVSKKNVFKTFFATQAFQAKDFSPQKVFHLKIFSPQNFFTTKNVTSKNFLLD